jgi:transposase
VVIAGHNPTRNKRRAKAAGTKTDAIDAYLLARTGRSDLADLRPLQPDSPLVQELKALSRDLEALIHSQTRLVNQLTACLKEYYPVALELFWKLHQPATLAFLQMEDRIPGEGTPTLPVQGAK